MADNYRLIENLVYRYAERIDRGDLAGVAEQLSRQVVAFRV